VHVRKSDKEAIIILAIASSIQYTSQYKYTDVILYRDIIAIFGSDYYYSRSKQELKKAIEILEAFNRGVSKNNPFHKKIPKT
jgi:hypothetical protein